MESSAPPPAPSVSSEASALPFAVRPQQRTLISASKRAATSTKPAAGRAWRPAAPLMRTAISRIHTLRRHVRRGGRRRFRAGARERRRNFGGAGRAGQASRARPVAQRVGQRREHADVLVRRGRDADHEPHRLAGIPLDGLAQLQHDDPGAVDQRPILAQPVGDGDAVAEDGAGLRFAREHAVHVARRDVPPLDQERAGRTDGLDLV